MFYISPFGPKKSFYEEQISLLKEKIKTLEVGSEEWCNAMQNLQAIESQKKNAEHHVEAKDVIAWITGIGSLAISAIGIATTWETAKMAYVSDEQMKLKNGDVWRIQSDYKNYYNTKPNNKG